MVNIEESILTIPSLMFAETVDEPNRPSPQVVVLPLPEKLQYREGTLGDQEQRLVMLAEGLASSPLWATMPEAVLVVRPGLLPRLGVIGYFDAEAEGRLTALATQIASIVPHLRYVSYAQAELDAEHLAERLVERFGEEGLRSCSFAAIPRGGLIVLGMLAYALGLRQEQMMPASEGEAPLVVVDDCALSGRRFFHYLRRCQHPQVVFAHLYSHPDLRRSIEDREPRVLACIGARDLHDHAPAQHQDAYPVWQARWAAVSGEDCYWSGQPDHLCFAWTEPDIAVVNPVTEEVELGWRLMSPRLCLKNRFGRKASSMRIQVQPTDQGLLRVAGHVLFGRLGERVVIGNTEAQTCFTLDGTAAAIWEAVAEYGTVDEVVRSMQKMYNVVERDLRDDVEQFIGELLAQELLEYHHES